MEKKELLKENKGKKTIRQRMVDEGKKGRKDEEKAGRKRKPRREERSKK